MDGTLPALCPPDDRRSANVLSEADRLAFCPLGVRADQLCSRCRGWVGDSRGKPDAGSNAESNCHAQSNLNPHSGRDSNS